MTLAQDDILDREAQLLASVAADPLLAGSPASMRPWLAAIGLSTLTSSASVEDVERVLLKLRERYLSDLDQLSRATLRELLLDELRVRKVPHSARQVDRALAAPTRPRAARPDVTNVKVGHNLTDAGNAEYFAELYGADVRHDFRRNRTLIWKDHRFQPDSDGELMRLAKAAIRQRFTDAGHLDDPDRGLLAKHAIASESRTRLDALMHLARAEPPIADAGDQWDINPWLLGVPNGVVDLQTGRLRPGRREDHLTMAAAVPFDPEATCPRWERFIGEVFAHDDALTSFVHRALGYSLTGSVSEQVFFFAHGGGSNGKGTLLNTIRRDVLGDYGHALAFSAIEHDPRPGAASNELAGLVGRRLVIASEASEGRRLDEGRLKWITGGDPIRARFLYAESFEFLPTAKFWLAANHKPVVHDDSHGFWRRVRMIPFSQRFETDTEPNLQATLTAEASGILTWCIRGCLAWQRDGLQAPPSVLAATETYRRDSDPLGAFLEEACALNEGSEIGASDFFHHYVTWAKAHGMTEREYLTSTKFGRKASERFEHATRRDGKVYLGIARKAL